MLAHLTAETPRVTHLEPESDSGPVPAPRAEIPSPRGPVPDSHGPHVRTGRTGTRGLAQTIITAHTRPGELICDPNPDTSTGAMLAAACELGRDALGLTSEQLDIDTPMPTRAACAGRMQLLDSADDPRAARLPRPVDLVLTELPNDPMRLGSHALVELYEDLHAVLNWTWPDANVAVLHRTDHPNRTRRAGHGDPISDLANALRLRRVRTYVHASALGLVLAPNFEGVG